MAFRGLFLDGLIFNPKTAGKVSLRLMGPGKTLPYMQSASITLRRGVMQNMSITLAPNYKDALDLMSKENEWIKLGNILGLRWGYTDMPGMISDWYWGFMQMPEPSFGEEISIVLPAETLLRGSNRLESHRVWSTEENQANLRSIAQAIAEKYGVKEVNTDGLSKRTLKAFDAPRANYIQGGRTDLQFLLAEVENIGIRLVLRSDRFLFIDKYSPLPGESEVNATFQMYGKIDLANNIYPMISFDSESMGTIFQLEHQGIAAVGMSPTDDPTKNVDPVISNNSEAEENAYSAKDGGTLAGPTDEGPAPAADMKDENGQSLTIKTRTKADSAREAGRIVSIPRDGSETKEDIQTVVSAFRKRTAADNGIKVVFGSGIALTWLIPGMFVSLEGVGDYFSCDYMLEEVEIGLAGDGATMTAKGFGSGFAAASKEVDPMYSDVANYAPLAKNPNPQDAWKYPTAIGLPGPE